MADRARVLIQKRTSLKSQITNLSNLLDKNKIGGAALRLRGARLTELYHAFEEYNDELTVLDPNDAHEDEFANIQERFYTLAGRIEEILNADGSVGVSNDETRFDNSGSVTSARKRRIKLPETSLPTFDGRFEGWLSFKNTFHNMIGSQTDLSDIDKLHYLKSALTGDAASKVKIFTVDGINYSKAWELLERAYEVKRILVSRHHTLMLNLPALEKETTSGLTKLADDAQQHVASLSVLGVSIAPETVVNVLESKLPKTTLDKWEATLERDEHPKPDQLYEFLYKTAVCASRRERAKEMEKCRDEPPTKKKRYQAENKAFILDVGRNCAVCKVKRHPLYSCDRFKRLSVPKRIETVRNAKVCYNCLRSHRDRPCKFSNCTICQKRHNTLLHLEGYTPKTDASKADTKVDAVQSA